MDHRSSCKTLFCVIILVALALLILPARAAHHSSSPKSPKRPSTYKFFWHDTLQNTTHPWTNTAAEVAGPNHNITGLGFGKVIVFNDSLTLAPALGSKLLGRGQGVYIYDRTQAGIAFNALLVFSAVIENEEYNGTLNFMGADLILAPSRDISVVGGTGDFEMARGIANLVTHSIDGDTFIVNVTSRLYYPNY
ncbi:disease resistance response protein 206 [Selaginella moellendorffii]|nr:disease resistance response protein 206 [Selaginella moellendorffii]|eukprot:XP_024541383.1 disease resistance response protein 206 [Selaginella moellendorffii]